MNFAEKDGRCKELGNKVNIPEDRAFGDLDAFEKVIDTPGVNYIILATPPGFRPQHIQAAIAAKKNLFTEKPVATDGAGVRKVLAAYDDALKSGLGVAAGTQRRHQLGYLETMKRIHDGAIGDLVGARCYWNQGDIWFRDRRQGMTDLDYQIHNWYHFCWLCGDHICEQHVHNLDVINWATQSHPLRALGMGGRTRPYKDPNVDGQIYNFFAIEYEYPNGLHVLSQCRQINRCDNNFPGLSGVSEAVVGTKGTCQVNSYTINGQRVVTREQESQAVDPYVQEHTDLIASIRAGKPINELKNVAESTLTAIMGRMSAYTGKVVSWDQALKSKLQRVPEKLSREMKLSADPLPVPGKTPLI
jgi:predicted dehydrogenase